MAAISPEEGELIRQFCCLGNGANVDTASMTEIQLLFLSVA